MLETSEQSITAFLLKILSNILFGIAGLSFLFGGRLLAELEHIDRLLGEGIGIGVAGLCAALGAAAKSAVNDDLSGDN